MARNLGQKTVRLMRAQTRGAPGFLESLEGLEKQLLAVREAPLLDPVYEEQIREALRGQSAQAQVQVAQARGGPATPAASASDMLAGTMALSRGLLAGESRQSRAFLQRFQLEQGILDMQGRLGTAALSASPLEALIQSQTAVRLARIQAEAAKASDFTRFAGAVVGAGATVLAGPAGGAIFGGASQAATAAAPASALGTAGSALSMAGLAFPPLAFAGMGLNALGSFQAQ